MEKENIKILDSDFREDWRLVLLSAMNTGSMEGMAGLLSLTSTTWTLTVAVLLSGGFPLSAA